MTCFGEGIKNRQVQRGAIYIHDLELKNERTTLDFKEEVSWLPSIQNE